jgi:hypothetical protein
MEQRVNMVWVKVMKWGLGSDPNLRLRNRNVNCGSFF